MYASNKIGRIRLSILGTAVLMIAAVTTPTFAATPGGPGAEKAGQATNSPNAYNLQGDLFNPVGSGLTIFQTTGAAAALGAWDFQTSSTSSGVYSLVGHCSGNSTNCTGVKGQGSQDGGVNWPSVLGEGGTGSVGVAGRTNGTFSGSTPLYGINSASGDYAYGVVGNVTSSTGVNAKGVYGNAGAGIGVYGNAGSGNGVYGNATSGNGVYGTATTGVALFGNNTGTGSGFYGFSANGPGGVMGSNTTEGARFYTRASGNNKYALVTGGLAGTFGNVYITGNYQATGTKSARVETSQGPRLMYATEGTQNIFTDQGTAQLVNGRAVITIDPLYAQTVSLNEPYQVFLTPHSADTQGLAAINLTPTGFEVRELAKGQGTFAFSWKVEALRKGYEKDRLEDAGPAPDSSGPAYEMPQNLPTAVNSLEQEAAIKAQLHNK